MPIYGDLYQNLQWSLTFDLKVVTHLKSAPEASYDVINMATIMRNCSLIKAIRLRAKKGPAPPPLGNFADISYLEENFKPHLLRDVCTLCSRALVSDSLLHMLL